MIVLAISCTIAVQKLGAERISCPSFTHSFPDMIGEPMDVLLGLVSMDKLQNLHQRQGLNTSSLLILVQMYCCIMIQAARLYFGSVWLGESLYLHF